MRKILAIALAVAMVMSMAAVSFAAVSGQSASGWATQAGGIQAVGDYIYRYDSDADLLTLIDGLENARYGSSVYVPLLTDNGGAVTAFDFVEGLKIKAKWEMGGELVDSLKLAKRYTLAEPSVAASGWYVLNGDDDGNGTDVAQAANSMVSAGTENMYYVVTKDSSGAYTFKNYLNAEDTEVGATVIASVKADHDAGDFATLKYYARDDAKAAVYMAVKDTTEGYAVTLDLLSANATAAYVYYIEIGIKDSTATRDADIIGTITLNKTKASGLATSASKLKDAEFDIAFNVNHKRNYLKDEEIAKITGNHSTPLQPDNAYLLKFDNDDEVDIVFGQPDAENEGTFTVDISGQGKVLLYFTTTANEQVVAANPEAKLYFVNFNNKQNGFRDTKFNRTGEMCYEWEDVRYAYQVITDEDGNSTLKVPAGFVYEAADEAVYFKTRALGNYVFSDVELTLGEVAPEVIPEEVVSNPETGGNK